ncbi:MAG: hypothetical protein GQ570_12875 [Helicobacteraceae bacterium]|nr:hypothetical protein [Helicobacteraceae bacterium]
MSRTIQMILSGIFIAFIFDYLIFLGIFLHYIKPNEIDIFYNVMFKNNQNILIFLPLSLLFGSIITYIKSQKLALGILTIFALYPVATLLISPVGAGAGEIILMKKDQQIVTKRYTYNGNIYYDGVENIFMSDNIEKGIFKIPKNKIEEGLQ